MGGYGFIEAYQKLLCEHPNLFKNAEGKNSIVIITDKETMLREQEELYKKADEKNMPRHFFDLGLIAEDAWVIVLRDLVIFPNGKFGCYLRFVNRASSTDTAAGDVVVMPVYNGKILIIRHFRHEARDWLWELPRGFGEKGLTPEGNAGKELTEETGLVADSITLLNRNDKSGMEKVSYFIARASGFLKAEDAEGIAEMKLVTEREFGQMIVDGDIVDRYSIRAYALASLQNLLPGGGADGAK